MTTCAAALAYRGLFPFLCLVVVLLGVLRFDGLFERLNEPPDSEAPRQLPRPLEPAVGKQTEEGLDRTGAETGERRTDLVRGRLVVHVHLVLFLVYRFAPNVGQRFRLATPGTLLAVVLRALCSLGFALYLANFAAYGATYGSPGRLAGCCSTCRRA